MAVLDTAIFSSAKKMTGSSPVMMGNGWRVVYPNT